MTYEEKLAFLDSLRVEVDGKAHVLGSWDFSLANSERADEPDEVESNAPGSTRVADVPCGTVPGRKGLPGEFIEKMYRHYLSSRSIEKTAVRFGRTRQSVWDIFRRRGLKLRKSSEDRAKIELTVKGVNYAPDPAGLLRATTGKRRFLHALIWEELHGPVPRNHQVMFKDGNRRNFDPENLECVERVEALARNRNGENGATKARRMALEKGRWKPKAPSGYDVAFFKWFARHGWLVREGADGSIDVWTNGDAVCKFQVNSLMLERLVAAGMLASIHGSNRFEMQYGLPEKLKEANHEILEIHERRAA